VAVHQVVVEQFGAGGDCECPPIRCAEPLTHTLVSIEKRLFDDSPACAATRAFHAP
jgi:hypothetical protein